MTLQWRPGLLPRLTRQCTVQPSQHNIPAMEAGTIAPADAGVLACPSSSTSPAMEAGTIAPADAAIIYPVSIEKKSCNGGRDYCPG